MQGLFEEVRERKMAIRLNTQEGGVQGSRGRGGAAQAPLEWPGECRDLTRGGTEGDGSDAGGYAGNPQSSIFLRQRPYRWRQRCHESPQVLTKRESG